jgi:hypothetical protein
MDELAYPRKKKVRWRWDGESGEHITFLNPKTGTINVLNPLAATIFNLSDGKHTVRQIVDDIVEQFQAPSAEQVRSDVETFLDFMVKQELVTLLSD